MNILVVQESDWIKRNPHHQHHLMERLVIKGHEVRVIDYEIDWNNENKDYISRGKIFKNYHKIHGDAKIDVIRPFFLKLPLLNYLSWTLSNFVEIERQVKDFKPDIIIGFGLINTYIASKIAKKHKIPFVYYVLDILYKLIPEKSFQFFGKLLFKEIIKNSDEVICINKKLADFTDKFYTEPENIKVISAGIDFSKFKKINSNGIREEFGLKEDDLILFFMGWIYQFSGVKEVAKELKRKKYDHIKLFIVGDGDAYQDLVKIKDKYNLENQLILTGKQSYDKIPSLISIADICILPAYNNEIMKYIVPIKVYEYMAMGKSVIATKLPGLLTEFGYDNGIVYVNKPEDVIKQSLIVDAVKEGKNARDCVKNNDWNLITNAFENILEKTIKR